MLQIRHRLLSEFIQVSAACTRFCNSSSVLSGAADASLILEMQTTANGTSPAPPAHVGARLSLSPQPVRHIDIRVHEVSFHRKLHQSTARLLCQLERVVLMLTMLRLKI